MQASDGAFVVAHFDAKGRVYENLFNLLKHIRKKISDRIVFVSTGLKESEKARLLPIAKVISRENYGYDFWSYKLGIDALGNLNNLKRLTLFNSSFITMDPVRLLETCLKGASGPSLRGITASGDISPHLQSYWISFEGQELINSQEFRKWWGDMTPISEKKDVILKYEIGMSQYFSNIGIPLLPEYEPTQEERFIAFCRAVSTNHVNALKLIGSADIKNDGININYADIVTELNPSHYYWDFVLRKTGVIKVDLVKNNPLRLNLMRLTRLVEARPDLEALLRDALS